MGNKQLMKNPNPVEKKITKIINDRFPDEMDLSMMHPNADGAISELTTLFQTELQSERLRIAKEVEEEIQYLNLKKSKIGLIKEESEKLEKYTHALEVLQIIGGKKV